MGKYVLIQGDGTIDTFKSSNQKQLDDNITVEWYLRLLIDFNSKEHPRNGMY